MKNALLVTINIVIQIHYMLCVDDKVHASKRHINEQHKNRNKLSKSLEHNSQNLNCTDINIKDNSTNDDKTTQLNTTFNKRTNNILEGQQEYKHLKNVDETAKIYHKKIQDLLSLLTSYNNETIFFTLFENEANYNSLFHKTTLNLTNINFLYPLLTSIKDHFDSITNKYNNKHNITNLLHTNDLANISFILSNTKDNSKSNFPSLNITKFLELFNLENIVYGPFTNINTPRHRMFYIPNTQRIINFTNNLQTHLKELNLDHKDIYKLIIKTNEVSIELNKRLKKDYYMNKVNDFVSFCKELYDKYNLEHSLLKELFIGTDLIVSENETNVFWEENNKTFIKTLEKYKEIKEKLEIEYNNKIRKFIKNEKFSSKLTRIIEDINLEIKKENTESWFDFFGKLLKVNEKKIENENIEIIKEYNDLLKNILYKFEEVKNEITHKIKEFYRAYNILLNAESFISGLQSEQEEIKAFRDEKEDMGIESNYL